MVQFQRGEANSGGLAGQGNLGQSHDGGVCRAADATGNVLAACFTRYRGTRARTSSRGMEGGMHIQACTSIQRDFQLLN